MPASSLFNLAKPTTLLAIGLMLIILVMVLPVPAWVMDIGLTLSFAFAILIFTTAIFIEKPLDFSSFPSVLLASLVLRLALNVSSTKLIISQGHTGTGAAGNVIEGFAMFIMGGNLFVGLVVFGVLIIVNFMVITKGAGRMAMSRVVCLSKHLSSTEFFRLRGQSPNVDMPEHIESSS